MATQWHWIDGLSSVSRNNNETLLEFNFVSISEFFKKFDKKKELINVLSLYLLCQQKNEWIAASALLKGFFFFKLPHPKIVRPYLVPPWRHLTLLTPQQQLI